MKAGDLADRCQRRPQGGRRLKPAWLLLVVPLALLGSVSGCDSVPALRDALATPEPTATPRPAPTTTPAFPAVVGADPSDRVAVFYYPWYRTKANDGYWDHWGSGVFLPPKSISSDFYPLLGAYSVADSAVLAQHFAWLREAGVGVAISSWWGQGSREDHAVPLMLDVADQYGVEVAFHIEPYDGRTADRLVDDVQYLYRRYGEHPAFSRLTRASRWSPDDRAKGLFFVWLIGYPDKNSPPVDAGYWQPALDEIHALPDGGLVIANTTQGDWVDGGHFDGLYNYATLHLDQASGFGWAAGLPPGAWYVPSVLPGFSAKRIGYPAEDFVPRDDGATLDAQWEAALDAGVEPDMVTITSFNEWHEGSQIEPAASGAEDLQGYRYTDYGTLLPDGYLTRTSTWAARFLDTAWPEASLVRLRVATSSDWTDVALVDGASWSRPDVVVVSETATSAELFAERLSLAQPLGEAEEGAEVELVVDLVLTGCEAGVPLVWEIERGHIGATTVEIYALPGGDPVLRDAVEWAGIIEGRNVLQWELSPAGLCVGQP